MTVREILAEKLNGRKIDPWLLGFHIKLTDFITICPKSTQIEIKEGLAKRGIPLDDSFIIHPNLWLILQFCPDFLDIVEVTNPDTFWRS